MIVILAAAAAAAAAATAPPDTVGEIEIVTRRPVAGDLQSGVLDYRPEYFTPVRPATAMDMVTWLPGFTFEDSRDLRGLAGSVGNVLIDGKPPTSKTDTLTTILGRIPSSQVERVDVIVGGAPGIDMRGRGGGGQHHPGRRAPRRWGRSSSPATPTAPATWGPGC